MPELIFRKRLRIVELLLGGHSYQTISERVGVSKGTIANVMNELRDGEIPSVQGIEDVADILRELAVEIRRSGLSIPQASLGITAIRSLAAVGVAPQDISRMVALCRSMTPEGRDARQFADAAVALIEAKERTGKGIQELEGWVEDLQEKADALVTQRQELEPLAKQVEALRNERDSLVRENAELTTKTAQERRQAEKAIAALEEKQQRLESQVQESQRLIGKLGTRFLDQEEEMRQVEHRLAKANGAIADLKSLGLPMERLPELAARLSQQARQQGVDHGQFLDWFLYCLEGAGSLLGLETQIKATRERLQDAQRELQEAINERDVAAAEFSGLSKQITEAKTGRRATLAVWKNEMSAVAETIRREIAVGGNGLKSLAGSLEQEVRTRLVQLVDISAERGSLQREVESYGMVPPLVSILRGDDGLSLSDARRTATAFCRGFLWYLEGNGENTGSRSVRSQTKNLLDELAKWRP